MTAFCAPRVEPEVAFLLRAPLRGPGVSVEDVMAATEAVAPALEIVDSRIADWRITLADTIADNASSAAVVLGEWVPIRDVAPLPETTATLAVNDTVVGTGEGTAVLGDPAAAVAWLANATRPLRHRHRARPIRHVRLLHHSLIRRGRRPRVGRHQRARHGHREFRVRARAAMIGIDPQSDGLARAKRLGVSTSSQGIHGLLALPDFDDIRLVFDATSAAKSPFLQSKA